MDHEAWFAGLWGTLEKRTPAAGFNKRQISGETKMPPILEAHGVTASKIRQREWGTHAAYWLANAVPLVPPRQGSCALGGNLLHLHQAQRWASHRSMCAALVPAVHLPGLTECLPQYLAQSIPTDHCFCDTVPILACIDPEGAPRRPMERWYNRYSVNIGARSCRSSHG